MEHRIVLKLMHIVCVHICVNITEIIFQNIDDGHARRTNYYWDTRKVDNTALKFTVKGRQNNILTIKYDDFIGDVNVELYIKSKFGKFVHSRQCNVNVIFHESPYFGIDLGTTYSCISYQNGKQNIKSNKRDMNIVILDKNANSYCIPSAIYFPENNKPVIFGKNALKYLKTDPSNVIYDIKRIIGRKNTDKEVIQFRRKHLFNLTTNDTYPKIMVPNYGIITCEQALSVLLTNMVSIASAQLNVPYLKNVVISVPALFNNRQRKSIIIASKLSQLNVVKLVVEPTAAALAYIYRYPGNVNELNTKLFLTFGLCI